MVGDCAQEGISANYLWGSFLVLFTSRWPFVRLEILRTLQQEDKEGLKHFQDFHFTCQD